MNLQDAYPVGVDCLWLGRDRNGNIAAFATAGEGPVPSALIEGGGLPDIGEFIDQLPVLDGRQQSNPRAKDFAALAVRGLYAFDWSDIHRVNDFLRGYELIARPTVCLTFADLPKSVREATVCFDDVDFGGSNVMFVERYHPCVASRLDVFGQQAQSRARPCAHRNGDDMRHSLDDETIVECRRIADGELYPEIGTYLRETQGVDSRYIAYLNHIPGPDCEVYNMMAGGTVFTLEVDFSTGAIAVMSMPIMTFRKGLPKVSQRKIDSFLRVMRDRLLG